MTSILIYFKEIYRKHALIGTSKSLKIKSQKVARFKLYQLQDQMIYRHGYETISFERLSRVHGFKNQESTKKCKKCDLSLTLELREKKTVTVTSILIYFKEIYRKHALIGLSQSL